MGLAQAQPSVGSISCWAVLDALHAEVRQTLRLMASVEWILRVHRRSDDPFFTDEDLAGVVCMIADRLRNALEHAALLGPEAQARCLPQCSAGRTAERA